MILFSLAIVVVGAMLWLCMPSILYEYSIHWDDATLTFVVVVIFTNKIQNIISHKILVVLTPCMLLLKLKNLIFDIRFLIYTVVSTSAIFCSAAEPLGNLNSACESFSEVDIFMGPIGGKIIMTWWMTLFNLTDLLREKHENLSEFKWFQQPIE